ncbi:hypothetical protein SXIM_15130 [Streptomyces xiamenensis]|uniref:Uncharacterized protein n=1 Tax=Streptomyces xiamenensis TaxID=408015 RepID=A0A0F7FT79_9ACTN|nr:hypothetical protein SXIM_15130 [Streptomyces xiamenensis]
MTQRGRLSRRRTARMASEYRTGTNRKRAIHQLDDPLGDCGAKEN